MINFRLRSAKGNQHLSVSTASSFHDLQKLIEQNTGVTPPFQKIMLGFPPKEVLCGPTASLQEAGIRNNDSVTLEERKTPAVVAEAATAADPPVVVSQVVGTPAVKSRRPSCGHRPSSASKIPAEGVVVRRVVDADNSCLFNSLGYVLEARDRKAAPKLRKVISDTVLSDAEEFNEGMLGRSNPEYSNWILKPQSWGGAIELSIFADYYKCEIAAFDIQTTRVYNYGEGKDYKQRVFLIYDGLHYDALAYSFEAGLPEELDVTVFAPDDTVAEAKALKLTQEAHKARQFTDMAGFTLRCGVCQSGLKGEKEALDHAKKTGHQNFSEYNK